MFPAERFNKYSLNKLNINLCINENKCVIFNELTIYLFNKKILYKA